MSRYNLYRISPKSQAELTAFINKVGSDPGGVKLMAPKGEHMLIHVENLSLKAANILKQELLSRGGDVALHRGVAGLSIEKTNAIMMATRRQLRELMIKLKVQPFGLKTLARELEELLRQYDHKISRITELSLPHGAPSLALGERTIVMGILNVTPDSFSDGGRYDELEEAIRHAKEMIAAGADIIDLGGESTRPGSVPVSLEEELRRVIPIIKALSQEIDVPISIDTYKAEVAREAIASGAHIINDVWGAKAEPEIAHVAARTGAPIILMHNRADRNYRDLIPDMISDLRESITLALEAGCKREQLLIDPGIGFAKDYDHNLAVMRELEAFQSLGLPILLGTSRKGFIGKTLDLPVEERIEGTIATALVGVQKGVDIVRVHDIEAVSRAVRMTDAIIRRGRDHG